MRATEAGVGVVAQKLLPPIEVTLNAAADTYIAQSTATLNFGTDTSIDITGVALSSWEAGLVRFDAAAIQSAVGANTLQTARLQLTMNGASLGAGNSQVAIHRMTMPWVEQRATWLCANDTDHSVLGRFVNNCTTANRWGIEWWSFLPRPFVEQPTATVTLGFGQTGVVTADVTSDVQLALSGTTHQGWLVASTANLSTVWARFSSREGSAAPKLILTMVPACTVMGPDTDCDGVDDNCNGAIDEGYIMQATSCGVGACARTGATMCVSGTVVNSCMPGAAASSDTTCDGIDQNCNGSNDEGYVSMASSCGVGACARTGNTSCVSGVVQNGCTPGTPAPSDTTCDNVDDNCNGSKDEGYVSAETQCGVGACARTGMSSCNAGVVTANCTVGMPISSTDANCDRIDDNCNGEIDESCQCRPSTPCTEGIGPCAADPDCVAGLVCSLSQNVCVKAPKLGLTGQLTVQAEQGTLVTGTNSAVSWTRIDAPDAADGKAVQSEPNLGVNYATNFVERSPRVDFRVEITAPGTYYVWVRGKAPGGGTDDTVHVGLDSTEIASATNITDPSFNPGFGWGRNTAAGGVSQLQVSSAGQHVINVWMAKDGFIFDELILTGVQTFAPAGADPCGGAGPGCTASCINKQCGPNGAFGSCGICELGEQCDLLGHCYDFALPCRSNNECALGQRCSLSLAGNGVCLEGLCEPNCASKQCGDDPRDGCGGICDGLCAAGHQGCTSNTDCGSGMVCGIGNGPRFGLTGRVCWQNVCETVAMDPTLCGTTDSVCGSCNCVPLCSGRDCGSDGCGGECGSCTAGLACTAAGSCVDPDLVPILEPTTETAGRLEGQFSVSDGGQARYRIPIDVPPGRNRMTPKLSVTYDSSQRGGYLGVGWNIDGLSTITRCNKTIAQDGYASAPGLNTADAYCLDGQRLIEVSSYEEDGNVSISEYRTEIDTMSRIYGKLLGPDGALSFQVFTRDGGVMTYLAPGVGSYEQNAGTDPPLSQVLDYPLATIADRNGNEIKFTYDWLKEPTDGGMVYEYYPHTIEYGADVSIEFNFDEPIGYPQTVWRSGIRRDLNRLLSHVITRVGTVQVLDYQFGYERRIEGGPHPRRLSQLQVCTADATCKKPTIFDYMQGSGFAPHSVGPRVPGKLTDFAHVVWDYNQDGVDDVLLRTSTDGAKRWVTLESMVEPSGVSYQAKDTGVPLFNYEGTGGYGWGAGALVDIEGDGTSEFLEFDYDPSDGTGWLGSLYVLRYDGSGFSRHSSNIPKGSGGTYVLDMNGDGLSDLLLCDTNVRDTRGSIPGSAPQKIGSWRLYLAGPDHGFASAVPDITLQGGPGCPRWHTTGGIMFSESPDWARAIDTDGDAREELLLSFEDSNLGVTDRMLRLDRFGNLTTVATALPHQVLDARLAQTFLIDINGDHLLDVVYGQAADYTGASPLTILVSVSRGDGTFETVQKFQLDIPISSWKRAMTIDADGDGLTDLAYPAEQQWQVLYCRASGISMTSLHALAIDVPAFTGDERIGVNVLADVDGDGVADWIHLRDETWINTQIRPTRPLLQKITDGFGAETRIHYETTNRPYAYTHAQDCIYPQLCVRPRGWVAHRVTIDASPLSAAAQLWTYSYRNARSALNGRGFVGYGGVTSVLENLDNELDVANIRQTTDTTFDNQTSDPEFQLYTFATMPKERIVTTESAVSSDASYVDTQLYYNHALTTHAKTRFPFVGIAWRTREEHSVSGDTLTLGSWVRHYANEGSPPDNFGNSKTIITEFDDGEVEQIDYTYQHAVDTSYADKWLINLVSDRKVTRTSPALPGETHIVSTHYNYYPATGSLRERVEEPGDANLELHVEYGRDDYGNATSRTVSAQGVTRTSSTEFDDRDTFPLVHWNELGQPLQVVHEPATGQLSSTIDSNGLQHRWTYDGFGRLRSALRPDGRLAQTHYLTISDEHPFAISETDGAGAEVVTEYDQAGRPALRRTLSRFGDWLTEESTFDSFGNRRRFTLPSKGAHTVVSSTYDILGRTKTLQTPDGFANACHRGNASCSTNPRGYTSCVLRDSHDRILSSIDPIESTESCDTALDNMVARVGTNYAYDPSGRLRTVRDASGTNVTTTVIDARGRVLSVDDPDTKHTDYGYDAFDQLRRINDANGRVIEFDYDALGRRIERREHATMGAAHHAVHHWFWDAGEDGTLDPTELNGWLSAEVASDDEVINASDTRTGYSYNRRGLIDSQSLRVGGQNFSFHYGYDAAGRLNHIEYPGLNNQSFAVDQSFGNNGAVNRVTDANNGTVYWRAVDINDEGRLSGVHFGNNVDSHRAFDSFGRTTDVWSHRTGSAALFQYMSVAYDETGNLRARSDVQRALQEMFTHDQLNRLVQVDQANATEIYGYRADGSLTTFPNAGEYIYESGHAHAPSSVGAVNYQYDDVGNRNKIENGSSTRTFTYNALNKVTSATTAINGMSATELFTYDAQDRRVRQQTTERVTTYFGGMFEERADSLGNREVVEYVEAEGATVAQVTLSVNALPKVRYLHTDHLGSVQFVTNETGATVEEHSYGAFGQERDANWTPIPSPTATLSDITRGFTGHEMDASLGLVNMHGRSYDPSIGQFTSADPFVASPYFSQSLNRYSYALNGPGQLTDPSGWSPDDDYHAVATIHWVPPEVPGDVGSAENAASSEFLSRFLARNSLGSALFGLSVRGDGTLNLGFGGSWNTARIFTKGAMQGFINHELDMSLRWTEDEEQTYLSGYELGNMAGMLGDLHLIVGGVLLDTLGGLGTIVGFVPGGQLALAPSAAALAAGTAAISLGSWDAKLRIDKLNQINYSKSVKPNNPKTSGEAGRARGVGGKGWRGDQGWRAAVRQIDQGGTIRSVAGKVTTKQEALDLIQEAGGKVLRIEGPHPAPNPHDFPHINYQTSSGLKGTIEILGF